MTEHPRNAAVDRFIAAEMAIHEDEQSVRGPGWYEGDCFLCDWHTSGHEPVVEDAMWDHADGHLCDCGYPELSFPCRIRHVVVRVGWGRAVDE